MEVPSSWDALRKQGFFILSVMGNSWDQGWDSTTLLLSVL
ncbi:hypothetical protein GYH30_017191 [Glycine max]|nr:hypothetical protein GYH30_017191 [Glycine max]